MIEGGRDYDAGRARYARENRVNAEQHTRHIMSDMLLSHYGADISMYKEKVANINYRMGGHHTNARDSKLDNQILSFSQGYGYDKSYLARDTERVNGMNTDQQLSRLNQRLEASKNAYQLTGDNAYKNYYNDIRRIISKYY